MRESGFLSNLKACKKILGIYSSSAKVTELMRNMLKTHPWVMCCFLSFVFPILQLFFPSIKGELLQSWSVATGSSSCTSREIIWQEKGLREADLHSNFTSPLFMAGGSSCRLKPFDATKGKLFLGMPGQNSLCPSEAWQHHSKFQLCCCCGLVMIRKRPRSRSWVKQPHTHWSF